MSSSLFSSKAGRGPRNVRKLSISSPLNITPPMASSPTFAPTTPPAWTVILRAKYDFEASAFPEMSLQQGDHVRLLERPGNGWLRVQRIHDIGEGLVPASYLDITVNDRERPVSSEWLHDYQKKETMKDRIASVNVRHAYLSSSTNFWFRMDVAYKSGKTTFCAMFYEDFVSFQRLLHTQGSLEGAEFSLPKRPISVPPKLRNTVRGETAARDQKNTVAALDTFVQNVYGCAQACSMNLLGEYIETHCTRKVEVISGESFPNDDAIGSCLVDGSIRVTDTAPVRNNSFSPTAPLPPVMDSAVSKTNAVGFSLGSPYMASNMKYSSYLNQSGGSSMNSSKNSSSVSLPNNQERPHLRHCDRSGSTRSNKSTTSLNSVIETYADYSSDELDDGEVKGLNSKRGSVIHEESGSSEHHTHGVPVGEIKQRKFNREHGYKYPDDIMASYADESVVETHQNETESVYDDDEDGEEANNSDDIVGSDSQEDFHDVFEAFQSAITHDLSALDAFSSRHGSPILGGTRDTLKYKESLGAQLAGFKNFSRTFSSHSSEGNTSSIAASSLSQEPRTPTFSHTQVYPSLRVLSDCELNPFEAPTKGTAPLASPSAKLAMDRSTFA